MPDPSLSYGSAAILHAIASGRRFGFDVMEATGLTSGTVYPALERLESRLIDEEHCRRIEGRGAVFVAP